jgi:hypothetical protein
LSPVILPIMAEDEYLAEVISKRRRYFAGA